MTYRSLRLCATGIALTLGVLALAGSAAWDAARRGDPITMPWSAAR
nr:hypothetical protein [Methylorubrum zatmanii]